MTTTHDNHTIPHSHTPHTTTTQYYILHLHTGIFSIFYNMANGEDNWKLHLLADLALIYFAPERLQQANATAPQQAGATTQQQAGATALQPSSPESSSGEDESPAQAPPSQGPTAVNSTAAPGKFTSKKKLIHYLTIYQRPWDQVSKRQPRRKHPDAPPVSTQPRVMAC